MTAELSPSEPKPRRGWWIAGGIAGVAVLCCGVIAIAGAGLFVYVAPRVQSTLTAMTSEPGQYGLPPADVTELAPNLPAVQPTESLPSATNFTNNEGRSEAPQAAWDGQGNLHVIWLDSSLRQDDTFVDIFHRSLQPNGQWSDVSNLTEGFDSVMSDGLFLLGTPDGGVCALWQGSKNAMMPAYYRRCWIGGQWGEAETIEVSGQAVMGIAPAFAPDGSLQIITNNMNAWYFHETCNYSGQDNLTKR